MEALTRLVTESLARYGLDRPVDYRRLQWSRWFRCESPHSLLFVPSKPGVFAIAEEVMDFGGPSANLADGEGRNTASGSRRMLAVIQFGEDDDMAFVLDRMMSRENPMRARLLSGKCLIRYVTIEEDSQRRSICNALNQWLVSSGEKASGIGAHFASSLELAGVSRTLLSDKASTAALNQSSVRQTSLEANPGSAETGIGSPQPFPSGF